MLNGPRDRFPRSSVHRTGAGRVLNRQASASVAQTPTAVVGLATICVALLAAGLWPAPAQAGKFNRVLSTGDAAPNFEGLIGVDEQPHSLADYEPARVLVIVFTCNHCPVAQSYQARLVNLQREYSERGVQLVALCSNLGEADDLPAMQRLAKEEAYNFPYLRDAAQQAVRAYGALRTPTALVFSADRKLAYQGAIDDQWRDASRVKRAYLRDAIEALLDGRQPEIAESKPEGCQIEIQP